MLQGFPSDYVRIEVIYLSPWFFILLSQNCGEGEGVGGCVCLFIYPIENKDVNVSYKSLSPFNLHP